MPKDFMQWRSSWELNSCQCKCKPDPLPLTTMMAILNGVKSFMIDIAISTQSVSVTEGQTEKKDLM